MFARSAALLMLSLPFAAVAQSGGAVQGRLSDSVTGRPIADATVQLRRGTEVQGVARSRPDGTFSFADVAEGTYAVEVEGSSHLRAVQSDVRVVLNRVSPVDFVLVQTNGEVLAEVVVSARASTVDPMATPNTVQLDREEIRRMPGSGGDVFRGLDVLPGVVATGEFSNFTVRGNGPRDNLIVIDGIPFDKVVHFDDSLGEQEELDGGGRYSIFAPNIIGRAKFSPGAWRAAEGGKNGSLLELEIADPNAYSSTLGARVDVVGAEVDYEGPSHAADNTRVLLSARSFDFSNLFEMIDEKDIGTPQLADVIFKSVTDWNDAHRFEVLAIHTTEKFERDVDNALASEDFEDVSLQDSEQDNSLLGLTWRWSPGDVARLRNTIYYRDNDGRSSEGEAYPDLGGAEPTKQSTPVREGIIELRQKEQEIGWRSDFSTVLASEGLLTAGFHVARVDVDMEQRLSGDWTRFVYDSNDYRADPTQRYIVLTPERFDSGFDAAETRAAAYVDYTWNLGDFSLTPGVRYDRDGFSGDSNVAPRLLLNWRPDPATHVWVGGGAYYQPPAYGDLAVDASNIALHSARSTQATLGVMRYLNADWRVAAEIYHQQLDDLTVFDDRTSRTARSIGEGTASGIDLMLAKRMSDDWSITATYSHSRARRDDELGEGEYDADWDRPHAFALMGVWQPGEHWTLSAKWRYASGRPTDSYIVHGDVLAGSGVMRYSKEYVAQNTQRMPAYHALSLRADYRRRFGPVDVIAYLDVINAYGRDNGNGYEWDERRGVNIMDGLDEPLPTLGLRFEYSWVARD